MTTKTARLSECLIIGRAGRVATAQFLSVADTSSGDGTFSLTRAEQAGLLDSRGTQANDDEMPASLDFVIAEYETPRIEGHPGLGLTEIRGDRPPYGAQILARLTTDSGRTVGGGSVTPQQRHGSPGMDTVSFGGAPMWLDQVLQVNPRTEPWGRLLGTWRPRF